MLLDGLLFSVPPYRDVFHAVADRVWVGTPPPFEQATGDIRWMISGVLANRGTLDCDEEAPLQRGELDASLGDERPEQVRLLDPAAGSVRTESWSPNVIRYALDLQRPTTVLVNQNWNEHWTIDVGAVQNVAGRLAYTGFAGARTVTLRYRPRSFDWGLRVSICSLLLALSGSLAASFYLSSRRRKW